MVSALAGGIATGFVQGMDIRTAQESKAAEIAARREDARLAREQQVTLQQQGFEHTEKLAKLRITEDKKSIVRANAATMFVDLSKVGSTTPNKRIDVRTKPPVLINAYTAHYGIQQTGPNGEANGTGYVPNPALAVYSNIQKVKVIEQLRKGDINFQSAISIEGVLPQLVSDYNRANPKNKLSVDEPKHMAKLEVIKNLAWNHKRDSTVLTNVSKKNIAAADTPYIYEQIHNPTTGGYDPSNFLALPKTKVAALRLVGITQHPDEIKKLSGDTKLLDWSNLRYLNNYLKDLKDKGYNDHRSSKHHIWIALENKVKEASNRQAYLSLLATKGRWIGPHKSEKNTPTWRLVGIKDSFSELHDIYSGDNPRLRKVLNSTRLPSARTLEDVYDWIVANGDTTGISTREQLMVALNLGKKIVIEEVDVPSHNEDKDSSAVSGSGQRVLHIPSDEPNAPEPAQPLARTQKMWQVTIMEKIVGTNRKMSAKERANSVDTTIITQANNGTDVNSGKDKILIRSTATLPDNKEFIEAISLDLNKLRQTEFFKTQMSQPAFQRRYEFYQKSGLYDALRKQSDDPRNADSYNRLYDIVKENFDFSTTDPMAKDKLIHTAISEALETRYKLFAQKNIPEEVNNSSGVAVTFQAKMKYKEPDKSVEKQLINQKNKITITTDQVNSLEDTITKLGLESIIKQFATVKTEGAQDLFNDAFTLILNDRKISLSNKTVREVLNIKTEDLTELAQIKKQLLTLGTVQSTEMLQKSNVVFQTISDLLTVGKNVAGKFASIRLFSKPQALVENPHLNSRSFSSGHDLARDGMTKSRLKQIEQLQIKTQNAYEKNIGILHRELQNEDLMLGGFGKAWKDLNGDQRSARLQVQAKIAGEYLKAKQTALKISLTYYFAGLVQGESGGRAISNEDFAILFRALWAGGVGGPMIEGGFGVIKEVMNSLKERNAALTEFLGWGKGTQLADNMIALRRARDDHAYDRSRLISTLRDDARRNAPIEGMPGVGSWVAAEQALLAVATPSTGTSHMSKENQIAFEKPYNTAMGSIIKDKNIGPDDAKMSIREFTAKSWEELGDPSKTLVKSGIANSIWKKMSKEGANSRTKATLDSIRYSGYDIGVGSSIDLLRSLAKGKMTRPGKDIAAKAGQAQKVLGLFIEEVFNNSRRR